eukprot:TRINITY_DN113338_c0_g1_i1.p1 TRINITY_DN113338_c0_g1~~TRINITY_DN113338_c0_g1_i1.p1  ORF type:complete len:195 (-),score=38.93 TRINITY_DN113338_c0_g1_i1:36-620(-)
MLKACCCSGTVDPTSEDKLSTNTVVELPNPKEEELADLSALQDPFDDSTKAVEGHSGDAEALNVESLARESTSFKEEVPEAPANSVSYRVLLDIEGHAGLGLKIDLADDIHIIVSEITGHAAASWNENCKPEDVIREGDMITHVNGKAVSATEFYKQILQAKEQSLYCAERVEFVFSRAQMKKVRTSRVEICEA